MYQESLNRYRRSVLEYLKRAHDRARRGSSKRRSLANKVRTYENDINFKETVREAVSKVHCKMGDNLDGPVFDGLYHINCAYGWCKACPKYLLHPIEKDLIKKNKLPFISFHTYELIHQCSEHGPLPDKQRACEYCAGARTGERKGRVTTRNKIVSKSTFPFQNSLKNIIWIT